MKTQGLILRRRLLIGLWGVCGSALPLHGQPIRAVVWSGPENALVQVASQDFAPGAAVNVNISAWDGIGRITRVHVFDAGAIGTIPTASAGMVSIIRTFPNPSVDGLASVQVLVSNGVDAVGGQAPPFARDSSTFVNYGVLDLGGVRYVHAINPSEDVREADVTVIAAVQRDVTGPIKAGKIRRVDALRNIDGNITGYAGLAALGVVTVDRVLAGNRISGTISSDFDEFNPGGNINEIIVGPSPTAEGIQGNILTSFGSITSVYSSGPIGTLTTPIRIEAGENIEQIRTVATNPITGAVELRPTDVHANIKAGTSWTFSAAAFAAVVSIEQGRLGTVEIGGALKGEVRCVNLGLGDGTALDGRTGITVRGPIEAPITIDLNANNADIIGSVIRQPVFIGWKSKGSVVAYGVPTAEEPDLGTIKSVKIGYQPNPPESFVIEYEPGLVGNDAGPLNLDPRLNVNLGDPDRSPERMWFNPESRNSTDGGTLDSTIFARHAESIELRGMTSNFQNSAGRAKYRKPRIEVQRIDQLRVDNMEAGTVWSGRIQYGDGQFGREVQNDTSDDYASIGSLTIGCMSPTADIYFKDTPLAVIGQEGISVFEPSMLGELHLPELKAGETIRIVNKLGAANAWQIFGTSDFGCLTRPLLGYAFTTVDESSPRGRDIRPGYIAVGMNDLDDREPAVAPRASIRIADPLGLKGQIVVNSNNAFGLPLGDDGWWGQVRLKSDRVSPESDDVIIAVDQNGTPFDAPLYTARAVLLGGAAGNGGGAIGQVPFSQKTQDSIPTPVLDINGNPQRYMPARSFNNATSGVPVRVSYYGPLTNVSSSSVVLEKFNDQTSTWSAVTSGFSVSLDPTAAMMNRDILVRGSVDGAGDPVIQPGKYRVRVKGRDAGGFNVDANPVLCDVGQPFGANPPVMASTFEFALTPRCLLGSGDPYPADIADDQGNPLWPNGIGGTANNINTAVNEGDYNLFFGANGFFFQSGLGTAAIGMFCDIANDDGSYPGDGTPFDPQRVNSGVNEGDYNAFFNTFFAGCSV